MAIATVNPVDGTTLKTFNALTAEELYMAIMCAR